MGGLVRVVSDFGSVRIDYFLGGVSFFLSPGFTVPTVEI